MQMHLECLSVENESLHISCHVISSSANAFISCQLSSYTVQKGNKNQNFEENLKRIYRCPRSHIHLHAIIVLADYNLLSNHISQLIECTFWILYLPFSSSMILKCLCIRIIILWR